MASGLAALLDDVAAIAKLAAASIDDVGLAAGKATSKAAGVVIDDTAVTPTYVSGLSPDRELPIIWHIALGSLRNKLFFLLPGALALSALLPWAITPLLMLGGAFLCFEGAEKIVEKFRGENPSEDEVLEGDAEALERERIGGAIRTDMILSAEILAIALADVAASPLLTQAMVLVIVSLGVTAGVYGLVALIVKMDDIGLHLAKGRGPSAHFGEMLVRAMPGVLAFLSTVGILAMLWVGGGIIVHGLEHFHIDAIPHAVHAFQHWGGDAVPAARGAVEWLLGAVASGVLGLIVGLLIVPVAHRLLPAH